MYETFYEPTEQDLKDYAQHCKGEKTMYSNEEATIYFDEHLYHVCVSDQPHPSTMYLIASYIYLSLFPTASLKNFARTWLESLDNL